MTTNFRLLKILRHKLKDIDTKDQNAPQLKLLSMDEETGIRYLRKYLIAHNLTSLTRKSQGNNPPDNEPMTTITENSQIQGVFPVYLEDIEIQNLLNAFLAESQLDVEYVVILNVENAIDVDFLRQNLDSPLSDNFMSKVCKIKKGTVEYDLCSNYNDENKIEFMIFFYNEHFWVMFDRQTWSEVIKSLEDKQKIKEFDPNGIKYKKEYKKIS